MRSLLFSINFVMAVVIGCLFALKITGNTDLSWWTILSPFWLALVIDIVVVLLKQGNESAGHLGSFFSRRRRMQAVIDAKSSAPSAASSSATWWVQ